MTREKIEAFVSNATFETTMHFEYPDERDTFVKQITDKWEEDKQIAIDEAFIRGQHSMHPF